MIDQIIPSGNWYAMFRCVENGTPHVWYERLVAWGISDGLCVPLIWDRDSKRAVRADTQENFLCVNDGDDDKPFIAMATAPPGWYVDFGVDTVLGPVAAFAMKSNGMVYPVIQTDDNCMWPHEDDDFVYVYSGERE